MSDKRDRQSLLKVLNELNKILNEGAFRANVISKNTLLRVKRSLGFLESINT